ncbi:hypothetical protein ACB098_01G232600 [Castanea mollissima]
MPGNEVEERIHNLYELDNSSQGQYHSQALDGNWPVLNYNQWVGKQRQIGEALSFKLKNSNTQQLDSLLFNQTHTQLTPRSEYPNIYSQNQQLNSNGYMFGRQQFQQENASGDSPTLTTNSERSEITEASTDFNFVGGKHQFVRGQQPDTTQTHLMQQSGYSDMQMLQQHRMFKQLQELQRQQQLQHFGDPRQQNSSNQISALTKQVTGAQISPVINGTPVNDTSQMFMNWMQRGTPPTAQGVSNRVIFSQDQGQALRSIGLASQQPDASLYGTPITSARGNMGQYSHLQGMSQDSTNLLTKASGQTQKPMMQSSAFSNTFVGDQVNVSSDRVCFPQGAFIPKQGLQGKNVFGQVPIQGLSSGVISGNIQLGNTLQKNASPVEFNGRQEQAGWPGTLQQKMQLGPSQGLVPLDPMEEKILYNMDDNMWDASFGRRNDIGAGGFGPTVEHTDYSNTFPSLQSGSWSALMQSAVAEASSSDTGLQEEWSGLTFQNTEPSTDNQLSNAMGSEKQQTGWLDSNLLVTSSNSKPFPVFNDSSVNSSFPGFQQSGVQFSMEQREALRPVDSHESIQKSTKNTGEWLDCNPKQKPSIEGVQPVQPLMHLDNAWAGQIFEHPETDAHQLRIASCNNASQTCSGPKGDVNEATYKERDSEECPWEADSNCGVSSFSRSTGGLEQLHSGTDSTLPNREGSQIFNFAALPNSSPSKACQETSQQVQHSNQLDYVKHVDVSRNKENQSMEKNQHQMSNGSHVLHNYHVGAGGMYEMQQNYYQKDNSYENYGSKGLSRQEQEHAGQLKFIGNVSSSAMNLDKGHLYDFHKWGSQGNSKVSEKVPSRGDLDKSTTFDRSVGHHCANVTGQTSENMLELLHKVDQSKENSTLPYLGSRGCNSLVPEGETPDVSVSQQYHHQSPASQGFTLKLAPPSQQLSNVNPFISFSEVASNMNFRQANSELGEKSQTWLASPSVQFLPSSQESSQRAHWDNKVCASGQASIPSSSYMHGSSVATFTSSPPYIRSQAQMQLMPNAPVARPSSQATFPGTVNRYPPFNLAQDSSPQISANSSGMSVMHQQDAFSAKPQNVWTNVPIQRLPCVESQKVPSMDTSTNRMETSLAAQGLNDQNSQKVGYGSSEFPARPMNSQGSEDGADQPGKERSQLQVSSGILDVSLTDSLATDIPDGNAFASGSLLAHSLQQDLVRMQFEDNNAPAASDTNVGSIGHSLKPSHVLHPNYSLMHQLQTMKDVRHDGQQFIYEHVSRSRNQMDTGLTSASPLNSLSSVEPKMQSFLTEAREDSGINVSPKPALVDRPHEIVASGQSDSQSQFISSNVVSSHAEHPQVNLPMAPSWFKQHETFRNGQMQPMYDARFAKTAAGQFFPGKPSQNLNTVSSVERIDADASLTGRVWLNPAAQQLNRLSAPYLLPSDDTDQCMAIVRPKKRKTATSDLPPWHKEVTHGSRRVQNISVAEHDWALATNRLIEKVEDDAEFIEDGQSMLRSKRRLILTTQLMQQLLCPAPVSFLSAKAASHYDTMAYFVAKLSLGDACCLNSRTRNGLSHVPLNNNNLISEKLKAFESIDDHFSEVVEDFSSRAKKLENDLLRLDKAAASILDVRVECQELEKFSVINRFAKFHVRPADSSATSSSPSTAPAPKPSPQRYVIAHPIPKNLPEGVPCLSL